jgi:hypothetical protein
VEIVMHCVQLADLAAIISLGGPAIMYRQEAVSSQAITEYWTSSRTRFELWHGAMARYQRSEASSDWIRMRGWWQEHTGVIEEILVSEILTRVVAAIAVGLDRHRDPQDLVPVTHSVYLSHIEAKNRVQHLMLFGRGNTVQNAVRLNRLRKGVERWIDTLIGRLWGNSSFECGYAIDPSRASDHAIDVREAAATHARTTTDWLLSAAMHDMLTRRTTPSSSLPNANQRVADSVLLMLQPALFDGVGTFKSVRMHRYNYEPTKDSCDLESIVPQTGDHDLDRHYSTMDHSFDRF